MATERWLPVVGWPGYEVSDAGRIRSHKRRSVKVMKPSSTRGGYLQVQLSEGHRTRYQGIKVHTLVLTAFTGPRPEGHECRHLNGDPSDNRLVNLRWGTRLENIQDVIDHHRHAMANRTHCPQGHPYDDSNTYVNHRGARECRTCRRKRALAAYHAKHTANRTTAEPPKENHR